MPYQATDTMDALGCIYLITCLVTGGIYVGQTIHPCIEDRFDEHLYAAFARKTRTYLYNAMRKYGTEAFSIELLCAVPYESLNRMEAYWADELRSYVWDNERNFNMVWCGAEKRRGIKHTEEAIAKMRLHWEKNRERLLERFRDPELRFQVGSANRGKSLSVEQRQQLSVACQAWWTPARRETWSTWMRENMSEERRAKISTSCQEWWTEERRVAKSDAMKARTTEEDRQRSSEASKKFWNNPENRKRMSEIRLGKKRGPLSEQARANMSAASKGKAKTQVFKDALKAARARKFDELFHKNLAEWIADPCAKKQWRYDITRKRRDGRLLEKYVDVLENTVGWSWS